MAHLPATSSESNAPDLDCVSEKAEEVDLALSSLAETDFASHFRLGELDYDNFPQFYRRSRYWLRTTKNCVLCFVLGI